jgi:hypothetical protein
MDLTQVSKDITKLMGHYGRAVAECKSVPLFSLWPFLKLVVLAWFWLFCLEIAFLVIFFDFIFFIFRLLFNRPNIVLGKYFYDFVRKPFQSAWKGEIPAFRIVRIRYLTKLLVFYHARERVDKLRKAISAKHLDEMVLSGRYKLSEEEKGLQDNFNLFDIIVKDPYQLGALVILGPALTAMSFVTQKIVFPIVKDSLNLYSQFIYNTLKNVPIINIVINDPDISTASVVNSKLIENGFITLGLVIIYAVWVFSSAWIDMRIIFNTIKVEDDETVAFEEVGLERRVTLPVDLIGYCIVFAGVIAIIAWEYCSITLSSRGLEIQDVKQNLIVNSAVYLAIPVMLGIIASIRRLWPRRARPSQPTTPSVLPANAAMQ